MSGLPSAKVLKLFLPWAVAALFLLACGGVSLPWLSAAPTPFPGIRFVVTVITPAPLTGTVALSAAATVTADTALPAAAVPAAVAPTPAAPTPVLTPSASPVVTITVVVAPITTPEPTSAPVLTPTAAVSISGQIVSTATVSSTGSSATPGVIVLLEPEQGFVLQPGINELEFKWRWGYGKGCQPDEGYGYEVRVWPAVTGYGPMGVTDAVKNQSEFFCDPVSQVASYRIPNLRGAPGVSAVGSGKFLWDVAYITLDPYTVVYASEPRLFEIP
ncbi:MAG: hypothetical protein D6784_14870 [Chloroflexi bacterium]|nr:MAG: hypothetical protein D6784_14870 [Chloroflexota bacterium]